MGGVVAHVAHDSCAHCGNPFIGHPQRMYCSAKCKEAKYRTKPGYTRNANLKKFYGISLEQWESIFEAQGKCCAICGTRAHGNKNWATDHDHKTGKVRAILCNWCNIGLGAVRDDPAHALDLAIYLLKHEGGDALSDGMS